MRAQRGPSPARCNRPITSQNDEIPRQRHSHDRPGGCRERCDHQRDGHERLRISAHGDDRRRLHDRGRARGDRRHDIDRHLRDHASRRELPRARLRSGRHIRHVVLRGCGVLRHFGVDHGHADPECDEHQLPACAIRLHRRTGVVDRRRLAAEHHGRGLQPLRNAARIHEHRFNRQLHAGAAARIVRGRRL